MDRDPRPRHRDGRDFQRAAQRLADNKRYAARNTKVPSLLQGLAACSACGYGYYRTSTRTPNKKIYYYRCLVLAAVQGERLRGGCVFAGGRGFRGGSGCGGVACGDTVSVSGKGRPSPLPFREARGGP